MRSYDADFLLNIDTLASQLPHHSAGILINGMYSFHLRKNEKTMWITTLWANCKFSCLQIIPYRESTGCLTPPKYFLLKILILLRSENSVNVITSRGVKEKAVPLIDFFQEQSYNEFVAG